MIYESNTWSVKEEDMFIIKRNDSRTLRWLSNNRPGDTISVEKLRTRLILNSMAEYLQDQRLQWLRHVEITEDSAWSSKCRTF